MNPFGLKFSQMILHTETSTLMYNWFFLFEVLHKPTLLPSTFNIGVQISANYQHSNFVIIMKALLQVWLHSALQFQILQLNLQ